MTDLERRGAVTQWEHPLSRALGKLVAEHNLQGAVLITFEVEGDTVATTSAANCPEFQETMTTLADRILIAIDDGDFDPD